MASLMTPSQRCQKPRRVREPANYYTIPNRKYKRFVISLQEKISMRYQNAMEESVPDTDRRCVQLQLLFKSLQCPRAKLQASILLER